MFHDLDGSLAGLGVLVFLAIVLLLDFLRQVWRARRAPSSSLLRSRLENVAMPTEGPLRMMRSQARWPRIEKLLARHAGTRAFSGWTAQAGTGMEAGELLALCAMAFTCVFAAGAVALRSPLPAFAMGAFAASLPLAHAAWRREQRMRLLQEQFPDALDLLGRAMRAGQAFGSALRIAAEEMPEPTAGEFRQLHDELNFGSPLADALNRFSSRVPTPDVRFFCVSVLVQRESGGNMAEIFGNLSRLIRQRLRLFARVRVLSSEGRLSAWILGLMPFALGGLLFIFNPTFMSPLWNDPVGVTMLEVTLVLMAAGVLLLVRIVRIDP
jgi:tight adherence protein B